MLDNELIKRAITITDIAREMNFSISTVSKAFSNSTDISETARTKILKCAIDMGYSFDKKVRKSIGKIAALVSGLDHTDSNTFEYQMLFGFRLAASDGGYDTEIIQEPEDGNWNFVEEVIKKDYSAAFMLRMDYFRLDEQIKQNKFPVVMFDHSIESSHAAYIGCDNEAGIAAAVNHLASLGHKKIAYYGGTPMILVSEARKKGFIDSMRENGLQVFPELIFETHFAKDYSYAVIPKVIAYEATAIICASDMLACYAMKRLEKMNISVPNDISIVGFDNVPLGEEMSPKLTTISQNSFEIGKGAYYVMENMLRGITISKLQYRPTLVVRESTCAPAIIRNIKKNN